MATKIKYILFLAIIITSFSFEIFAQQDSVITNAEHKDISLSDAIKTSLERNYQVKISEKEHEISENNNSWGRAGRYPTVSLNLTQGNRYDNTPPSITDERTEIGTISLSPSLNANWVLFNGFSVRFTKKNLEEYKNISEDYLKLQIENTIYQTILGYYDILLQKEKLNILNQIMDLSRDRYDYVKARKELGSAVTFDVLQVKDAFLSDSSNYILQKLNFDNSIRVFNKLLADTVYISYNPTDEFNTDFVNFNYEELKTKMLENNKTLKIQNMNQNVLRNDIALQKSSLYPSISLRTGIDNSNLRIKMINPDAGTSNTQNYDAYANLTLSYTIFNGLNRRKNIQNATIEEEIGKMQIEDIKLSLNNQLLSMLELYNARKQLYNVANESVITSKLNLEIAKDKFASGAINSFNYRDIQLSFINASFKKLEAIYMLISSHNDLLILTGEIISKY
ncbi:MAG: TolC family protein [Bacteroidales bacterium]|nr:TolC family protein [Bacteroidales bacterium]MBN2758062.1 TolC family protein [Bacteroidales bacterium]